MTYTQEHAVNNGSNAAMTATTRSDHQSGANASTGEEPSDNHQAGATARGPTTGMGTTQPATRNVRDSKARGRPNKKAEGEHTLVFLREEAFVEPLQK